MNKSKKSLTKYDMQQRNKKTDNAEEAPIKKSMKIGVGNEPPNCSPDSHVSGHSTPIRKKDYVFDVEDSPELEYHYSPISLPCTQDGGNEIAWDWQTTTGKNSNDKPNPQNNLVETPKRTKQLQKKRNSNSPLLQKPLKRKQVKMENIENIGKLTAELKALSDRMKSMRQNCESRAPVKEDDIKHECGTKLLIELDNESTDDVMLEVGVNNDKPEIGIIATCNNNKKGSNYEDLFDDSIDDSMVKCSQEIEEKLNLHRSKGSDIMELSTVNEEKELLSTSEKETQYLTTSNNSTESSKYSNTSKCSSLVNTSSRLKTYSNNSSKMNSTSSISIASSKDTSLRKPHLNNNVINAQSNRHMLQEKDMSEFPDDSFDDCLATCMEDEKVLSKLSEYDFSVSNTDSNLSHFKKTSKQPVSNIMNNKKASNNFVPKTVGFSCNTKYNIYENSQLISDDLVENNEATNYRETIQKSFTGNNALENRKFFKTKSLSDQYFYQSRNFNASNKTSKPVSSSEKRSQSNSVCSSVSTTFPTVKGQNPYECINISSTNGMENAHALNRLDEKKAGNCIVKCKSTSNLFSIKEVVKESQTMQCTPQEIERKRLEAKMRLEAKRKSQQNTRVVNAPSEVPVKKSVKR